MMLHAADPGAYDSKDGFGDLDSDIDSDGVRTCHCSQWYSCTITMTSPALLRFWRQDEERDWNSFDQNGLLRPTRPDMEVCVHVCIYTILERLALTLYLHHQNPTTTLWLQGGGAHEYYSAIGALGLASGSTVAQASASSSVAAAAIGAMGVSRFVDALDKEHVNLRHQVRRLSARAHAVIANRHTLTHEPKRTRHDASPGCWSQRCHCHGAVPSSQPSHCLP